MEKFESRQIENKEKFGENIEMVIDLIRHAEKGSLEGGLTKKGENEAREYGKKLRKEFPKTSGIKIYHSGVERAQKTGELIKGEDKFKLRQRKSLTLIGKLSSEFGKKLVKLVNKQTGDETEVIQALIDTGAEKPDKASISSRELSQDMAVQLLSLIRMSKKFKENARVNVVLASHSGVIEHFLVDILNKERKFFLEEIGGPLKFLEGIRLIINRQDKESVAIKLKFRDYELDINEEDLESVIKK